MDISLQILIYISIVLLLILIIAAIYLVFAMRRINIFFKKADFLVEDWTYKSEMLNSGVETIANFQNYVDTFNVAAKKNIKSLANLTFRNRNMVYYFINKVRTNIKDNPASNKNKRTKSTQKSNFKKTKEATTKKAPSSKSNNASKSTNSKFTSKTSSSDKKGDI